MRALGAVSLLFVTIAHAQLVVPQPNLAERSALATALRGFCPSVQKSRRTECAAFVRLLRGADELPLVEPFAGARFRLRAASAVDELCTYDFRWRRGRWVAAFECGSDF